MTQVKSAHGHEVIDLVAAQDARLKLGEDKVEFLATLTTFGVQSKP